MAFIFITSHKSFKMPNQSLLKRYVLLICIISVVAIIGYWSFSLISFSNRRNDFQRKFIPAALTIIGKLPTGDSITEICGISQEHIYFQTKRFCSILTTDRRLEHSLTIAYYHSDDLKMKSRFECIVDSPNAYIFSGNKPAVIYGKVNGVPQQFNFPLSVFSRCVAIPGGSFVFRGFDTSIHSSDMVFFKGNPSNGTVALEHNLTVYENAAGIPSDGLLHFDQSNNALVFIYFYKNQFLCFDTNLNKKYLGRTIDTVSTNAIRSDAYRGNHYLKITSNTPRHTINKQSCVFNGLLFNNSTLKADNETLSTFKNNDVIDIYSIKAGAYIGSFYIPHFDGAHLQRFKVGANILVVLYKHQIITYKLPDNVTGKLNIK